MRGNVGRVGVLVLAGLLAACEPATTEPVAGAAAGAVDATPPAAAKPDAIAKTAAADGDDGAAAAAADGAALADAPAVPPVAAPARPIDPEAARVAAKRVAGVRSVVWMDDANLFAIVESGDVRTNATIDGICRELAALGDTAAVVVNLQNGAARTGDELEILGRACVADSGATPRAIDVIDPALRAEHRANQDLQLTDEERRNQEESVRALADETDTVYD